MNSGQSPEQDGVVAAPSLQGTLGSQHTVSVSLSTVRSRQHLTLKILWLPKRTGCVGGEAVSWGFGIGICTVQYLK